MSDLVTTLKELPELGVGLVSLTEALAMITATGRAMVGYLRLLLSSNTICCASVFAPVWLKPN